MGWLGDVVVVGWRLGLLAVGGVLWGLLGVVLILLVVRRCGSLGGGVGALWMAWEGMV